jgi:hypothetical protein
MKEAGKGQKDSSNASTRFIVREGAMWRGTPARELESPATYRLGVVWRGNPTAWENSSRVESTITRGSYRK